MAKLNAAARRAIPSSKFGLPGQRKYPMPDRSHAEDAKRMAGKEVKAGKLSRSSEAKIDRKADRMLGHKPKPIGPAKPQHGHTNIVNPSTHARKLKHE